MRRKEEANVVDRLRESYDLLVEIMENPQKAGYLALIRKMRFGSSEPINLKLFDFKDEIDCEIKDLTKKILHKIGLDKLPDTTKRS